MTRCSIFHSIQYTIHRFIDFSFNIQFIAMKSFPLIFWLNSEYFEYRQWSNRFTNKKVTGFKKKTKTFTRPRYVCLLCFYFHFRICYVNTERILYQQRISLKKPCKSTDPKLYINDSIMYINRRAAEYFIFNQTRGAFQKKLVLRRHDMTL